jgi:hypothetical protein
MRDSYPQELYTGGNNLYTTRRAYAQNIHIFVMYLTIVVRSLLAGEPLRRIARRRGTVLLAGLLLFGNMPNASAINTPRDINNYKLYAHMKVVSAKEYRCLELLWMRESRWDPRAANPKSSAYGIPQLLKLKVLDPYLQIDLGLKYITHRHSTPCKAWAYHLKTGHY